MGNKTLRVNPVRAALAGLALAALPMASFAFVSVGVSITVAPPALPVYVQPPCPAVGYIWTPGYWAYDDDDYYWVPGTWIMPPAVGLLWTPGYWGWDGGLYFWHAGYWGPHVGFYGGVNYGYGYGGVGFDGGYWRGGAFWYNRSVANLGGIHVTNVYNRTVVNNITVNRVSYNGGEHGLRARPNSRELAAEHDRHVEFTPVQREHEHMAFGNRDLRASANGGRPRIAATERPGVFAGHGVVAARAAGAPYRGGADRGGADRGPGRGPDIRTDRPGSRSPEVNAADHGSPGRGAEFHGDRPGARGAEFHGADRAGPPAVTRNDRPPSRVPEARSAEPSHPQFSRPPQSAPHVQEGPRPQQFSQRAPQSAPQAPRMQETPRMHETPRMQEAPRMQAAPPRMQEAPRQQSMPRPDNVPRQQNMGRPDMYRGGGNGEPRGQGQPRGQGPEPRDRARR